MAVQSTQSVGSDTSATGGPTYDALAVIGDITGRRLWGETWHDILY
jgi:hypothetical protein